MILVLAVIILALLSMIETIIQVDKDAYPFDEPISHTGIVSVEAIHEFTSLEELLAKKRVMQPKTKVHGCLHVIKLKKIYQQDLRLHFIYEYVPYSLRSYISQLTDTETSQHVSQMTRQLFISKLDHQLTILVGYLVEASLRI